MSAARDAESADPTAAVALRFALAVMRMIGHVSDAELNEVKAVGFSDAGIMEMTAAVSAIACRRALYDPPPYRRRSTWLANGQWI